MDMLIYGEPSDILGGGNGEFLQTLTGMEKFQKQ